MSRRLYQDAKVLDWSSIEEKWRGRWDASNIFETEVDTKKEKYFITVAYPYPNSPQHVGHGRTYTLADVHARYMRMKGYNVLFPMAFHYTGTPIVSMSQRVLGRDMELLNTFRTVYNLSEDVISTFVTPIKIASFFHKEIKQGMKEMGYSIDWRREFTTIDKGYSQFISWHFRLLREKGLIVQGSHPVGWCPKDHNPVSQHDTMGDVEPDFLEYTLIKFNVDDEYVLPTATLRPETIFGVTNLWINPDIDYVIISIDDERWIVTQEAAKKLEFLNHNVKIITKIKGSELVGKLVKHSFRDVSIPIYPASFVDPDNGTGIVMSVPGHAPYDYQALEDLKKRVDLQCKYQINNIVSPIEIIHSNTYQGNSNITPAEIIIKAFAINDQHDPKLEEATHKLYADEFYSGVLLPTAGRFSGLAVKEGRSRVREDMATKGLISIMYELVNKTVRCRCGTACVVKLLTDQWFLDYGNEGWKKLAHECINSMDIIPEEIRLEFNNVVDWLKERACARKVGLGTKLPWDPDWIIESLSDSVIYMIYYILSKYFTSDADGNSELMVHPDNLNDEFFNYVLLGKGDPEGIAKLSRISLRGLNKIRNEFLYFYPVDSRHSGRDLVPNHLSFFIFNHVALFGKEFWPKQIVVNGSVLMQGKKMSKSLGNIIPLRTAIRDYGADPIRLAMLSSSELLQDADFSFDIIKGIRSKLHEIYETIIDRATLLQDPIISKVEEDTFEMDLEEKWLLSRLQHAVSETTQSLERLRVREALQTVLYFMDRDFQWYKRRRMAKKRDPLRSKALGEFVSVRVRLLAPFAPYICEEIWEIIEGKGFITSVAWPQVHKEKINATLEEYEDLIENTVLDIQKITKVTKIVPKRILIYTASKNKWILYKKILGKMQLESQANFGDLMKELVNDDDVKGIAKTDPGLIKKINADILSDSSEARQRKFGIESFDEEIPLRDALTLIPEQIGFEDITIDIISEDHADKYDPKGKSRFARPFKPAIYLE
ncbi:MAG: leucine--tRNA ligase [Thermoproteota archaeon]|nr:leucine--tRNA ligase [Thermoproteota archaeon]